MLEIIGWLLCTYLFVKGLELLSMKRQEGSGHTLVAYVGAVIAILASFLFFALVTLQGESSSAQQQNPPSIY